MNYANNSQTVSMHNTYGNWPLYGSETASAVHSRGVYSTSGRDNSILQMSEYDNDSGLVAVSSPTFSPFKYNSTLAALVNTSTFTVPL